MKQKYVIGVTAALSVLALVYVLSNLGGLQVLESNKGENPEILGANEAVKPELPDFAQKTVRVEEAYIFAVQNQDKLKYISCYCGCANMQHSTKLLQHNSLKDCYLKPDGSFEAHASSCKTCNDITLKVKELLSTGYSLREVRKTIDNIYSNQGIGTNTLLPPQDS